MTSKEAIIEAIESERRYQKNRWGDPPRSITEFLVYIRDYTEQGLHDMTRVPDAQSIPITMDTVRKITALGFACMEQHGAQLRTYKDSM